MRMIKEVKRNGNSAGINFTKEERKVHNIKVGSLIDCTNFEIVKKKNLKEEE